MPIDSPENATAWGEYTDLDGYFRLEVPVTWRITRPQHVRMRHHRQQGGQTWHGRFYRTELRPPPTDGSVREFYVCVDVTQWDALAPSFSRDLAIEPEDASFLRTYRITDDSDLLGWHDGTRTFQIQYGLRGTHISHPYDYQPPPPLLAEDRTECLALVQRMLDSLVVIPEPAREQR
ncbi:MAG: hypothetical protein ACLQUY_10795 [Ktedonobacterales bacterium]